MKKNTGNKKVMRAIAVALATVVTVTSTPITTLAEEGQQIQQQTEQQQPAGEAGSETPSGETQTQPQNQAPAPATATPSASTITVENLILTNQVAPKVEDAITPVNQAINDNIAQNNLTSVKEAADGLVEVGLTEKNPDGTDKLDDNNQKVKTNVALKADASQLSDDTKAVIDGNATTDDLDVIKEDLKQIDQKSAAKTSAENAMKDDQDPNKKGSVAQRVDQTVSDYSDLIGNTYTNMSEHNKNIANAGTIADANKEYELAVAEVKAVDEAYQDALDDLDDLQIEHNKKIKAYEDAKKEYDDMLKKAAKSENGKTSDIDTAKAHLETLKSEADALKTKAEAAKDKVDELERARVNAAAALDNDYQDILDAQAALKDLNESELKEGETQEARQAAIEAKNDEINKLIIKSFIKRNFKLSDGTSVTFGTETKTVVTGFRKTNGVYDIVDGKGVEETATTTFQTVTFTDADGEHTKLFKIGEDGQIIEYTADVEDDQKDIILRAHEDAVTGVDDYFIDGDQSKAAISGRQGTNDVISATAADGTELKIVPNYSDKRIDSNTTSEPKNGNGVTYERVGNEKKTYAVDETLAFNPDGTGATTITDKKLDGGSKDDMKSSVNQIVAAYNLTNSEIAKGYSITIKYDTLFQHESYTIDNFNNKDGFWAGVDNFFADLFGTSSYSVILNHTVDKVDGIVENVYQDYKKTTTNTQNKQKITSVQGTTSNAKKRANAAIDDFVNEKLKGYTKNADGTYSKTTTIDGKTTVTTYKVYKVQTDLFGCFYDVKYDRSEVITEQLTDQLIATNCYGSTTYKHVVVEAKDEVTEVKGTTTKLNQVAGNQLKESDLQQKLDNQKEAVEADAKLKQDYEDAVDSYSALATAAGNASDKASEAQTFLNNLQNVLNQMIKAGADTKKIENQIAQAKLRLAGLKTEADGLKDELDKAKEELDKTIARLTPDDEEGDDDDRSPSSGGPSTSESYVLPTGITVVPLTTTPSGVAGVRTRRTVARGGAADTSGVLGVKNESTDTKKNVVEEKKDDTKTVADNSKKGTKVADPETPLAAPLKEGIDMNWLWLLLVAAATIVAIYTYENHKKKVAANDEVKKYKK